METREHEKRQLNGDLAWEEVYPLLKGEMMREAQARFGRYLQIAFEIAEAHDGQGSRRFDTPRTNAMIEERSKPNKP